MLCIHIEYEYLTYDGYFLNVMTCIKDCVVHKLDVSRFVQNQFKVLHFYDVPHYTSCNWGKSEANGVKC